jgi:hypothetical protein
MVANVHRLDDSEGGQARAHEGRSPRRRSQRKKKNGPASVPWPSRDSSGRVGSKVTDTMEKGIE